MSLESLSNKLKLFQSDELLASLFVNDSDLHQIGINHNGNLLMNFMFECNIMCQSRIISSNSSNVFLGAHSYINDGGYLRAFVFVGRYCSIGRRVTIGAGMHNMTGISTAPVLRGKGGYTDAQLTAAGLQYLRKRSKYTILENDVWVGDGAIICPGVRIATGAVIGANSVVTRDVAPYMVVAGAPALPIRCRFSPSIVEALLRTQYWEYPTTSIQALPCSNVLEFIDAFESVKLVPEEFDTFSYKRL
jgi:acetyltransferase-like isoleucine patch superfamily enzyme